MRYITEIIGEEYKRWEKDWVDTIFIEAPTGCGKSYFILHELLPYVVKQKKRMLYLVNRSILKDQLEQELNRIYAGNINIRNIVDIELYQTLETNLLSYGNARDKFDSAGYVICDECHYFLMDSNFNTNTIKSFRWIVDNMKGKITIFMSATIDRMKACIEDARKARLDCYTKIYRYKFPFKKEGHSEGWSTVTGNYIGNMKVYGEQKDYSYVEIGVIDDMKKLNTLVVADRRKWLIFIDNIELGKKLRRELREVIRCEKINNRNVVLLTSEYDQDDVGCEEVENITTKNKSKAQILISTCVMDNGISIRDLELRSIVILADTKEEFIQMLGRKRKDGEKLQVYIFKQPKSHFSFRLHQIIRKENLIEKYKQIFWKQIEYPLAVVKEAFGENPHGITEDKKRARWLELLVWMKMWNIDELLPPNVRTTRQRIAYLEAVVNMIYEIKAVDGITEEEASVIKGMSDVEKINLRNGRYRLFGNIGFIDRVPSWFFEKRRNTEYRK